MYSRRLYNYIYLMLYANDILIATTNMFHIDELRHQLRSNFEMKDLGAPRKIVGMKI